MLHRKFAFTLIELLVVIAIIAILAAILFPVFAQAKAAAKDTVNLSNQKQIGLAILMYCTDHEDVFPLAQRYEPSVTALFGLATWQTDTQPYMKNWGIMIHPKNSGMPTGDPSVVAWNETQHYGVPPKAENQHGSAWGTQGYFQADTATGSFARRVCGNQPCKYEGFFGNGCGANAGECPWYGSGDGSTAANTSSYSQTSIDNVSGSLLASEGAMWDLWMGIGYANPCTYGVYWIGATNDVVGAQSYHMACPHARKAPRPQAPDGACTPNLCDGMNFGIQNGLTTFVAADGHAIARDYRGGVMATARLSDGSVVIKSLWPSGGF